MVTLFSNLPHVKLAWNFEFWELSRVALKLVLYICVTRETRKRVVYWDWRLILFFLSLSGAKLLKMTTYPWHLLGSVKKLSSAMFRRWQLWSRGGTHIFGRTGMCRSNGSLFLQEILKHGSHFLQKKSLDMGQLFWMSTKLPCENPEIAKFLKNRSKMALFFTKFLTNGYPFWPKSPLKMGMGFEVWAAHPCPTQIWVPPGCGQHNGHVKSPQWILPEVHEQYLE